MSTSAYLDMLDESLRAGLDGVSRVFVDLQAGFVSGCQQSDGGFCGRRGGSDLYYSDFAVRTLVALSPGHSALERAAEYVVRPSRPPRGVIECFSVLNICRMLALEPPKCASMEGGMARSTGGIQTSAYQTFLAALCYQMLGVKMPEIDRAIEAVRALECPDGGFVESAGLTMPQTNATAAATAFLMMCGGWSDGAAITARFLAGMQCVDGGLKAHATAAQGDLLSTFTGLTTLGALGGLHLVDLAGVARFLRNSARSSGGFGAIAGMDAADVEYTYYGIGTLALLRTLGIEDNAVR